MTNFGHLGIKDVINIRSYLNLDYFVTYLLWLQCRVFKTRLKTSNNI